MNNLNAVALIKAGRAVREPFELSVVRTDGAVSQIIIRKILRLLPGRRIVAVADYGDDKILVKLFIGRSSERYSRREVRGVKAIAAAGVLTPVFKWQGALATGGGRVVAFEYLEDARDLIDEWEEATDEVAMSLMRAVIPELGRLHQGGVVQNDIHPENFLISGGQVYTIDGGDVSREANTPVPAGRSLDNLALFLAQFHARYDVHIPEVLSIYAQARGWQVSEDRARQLSELVLKKRKLRKNDYIEKAFRECTRFSCQATFRRFTVLERKYDGPEMQILLGDLDGAIEKGQILKKGNTATVALVQGPEGPLVIKRYNIKSYRHLVERLFRKSRAWVSWANTIRLEFLGISTLKPVALIEERFGPLRGRAYFITEYIDGSDATGLVDRNDPEPEMTSIVEIIRALFEAGVTHGDLKASNFLLTGKGAAIIDLDSMIEHSRDSSKRKAAQRDRDRFMKNWTSTPDLEKRFADLLG